MKGLVAAGAQVLLFLPFVLSLSLSSEITFSSYWSGSPVCAGFSLEMTCIVHLRDGINSVSKVTVIKDRGKESNMYCNVWPVPSNGEAECGGSINEGTMNLLVNGTVVEDHSLVLLIVLQSVRETDSGGYECSVGMGVSGNLAKVSTTALTLDVKQRSQCTHLPEIPFSRSLVLNSTNSPMCIFSVMPSSFPLWMVGNDVLGNDTVKFIKSGDYMATWINIHQLKNNDENNAGLYSCELKLNKHQDETIHLHTFQNPSIKFYVADSCSNGYLFCIEVWVISSSSLLSPITCTVDDNFEVRYVGSRSAVISSCSELNELQQLNNSSLRCEARNQFGRSEKILNVTSIASLAPEDGVYPSVETSTTDQTAYIAVGGNTAVNPIFPELFESTGIILFSVLMFLVIVVITCLGICAWTLRSNHKTRFNQGMKGEPFQGYYWSFLPKENKQRSIKERALPHRPDSVYASCETDLSVAIPPEKEMKCPAKPPQPFGYVGPFGPNTGETQDNIKCQFCSCKTKFETNILPTYSCQDKTGSQETEQKYLMKEDFRPGYIVPLVGKQARDITFNTYDMHPYSKLIGGRKTEGALRRSHSVLDVSPPVISSDEELNRNRKFSF